MGRLVTAVIPARMGSKRFPAKVMYPYRGRPLLYYVWREIRRARLIDQLVIATDNREIRRTAEQFGAKVMMTSARHQTGSDRTWEVVEKVGGEIIVNIQADNFGLGHTVLDRVVRRMTQERNIRVATLVQRVEDDNELFDHNLVKVLISGSSEAIWFSRYPLPYIQHPDNRPRSDQFKFYGHIGVYFFRKAVLKQFAESSRTLLEKAESLEQLRLLEQGERIRIFKTRQRVVSVDCTDDVKKLAALYN